MSTRSPNIPIEYVFHLLDTRQNYGLYLVLFDVRLRAPQ